MIEPSAIARDTIARAEAALKPVEALLSALTADTPPVDGERDVPLLPTLWDALHVKVASDPRFHHAVGEINAARAAIAAIEI